MARLIERVAMLRKEVPGPPAARLIVVDLVSVEPALGFDTRPAPTGRRIRATQGGSS